jgi:carbon monoxide dehydrogenase subunit G
MKFENRARVPVGRDKLWDFLMDIKAVGQCIPGVEEVREIDQDNYIGVQKIRVGPIGLRFEGKLNVAERDKQAGRAVMKAEGNDKRAGGAVKATITMSLTELGPNETELLVDTDANVMGKLGEFGQPVMRKKADQMMNEFAQNVSKRVSGA